MTKYETIGSNSAVPTRRLKTLLYIGVLTPTILGLTQSRDASAGQLTASAFQPYAAANFSTIQPGPFSLYTVNVGSIAPTQQNEGFTEVGKKAAGFDLLTPSTLPANLLTAIEPVVIGPGGKLYVTDGHHTFTALDDSIFGASNPTVYVNVIANYSNLTTAQFFATLQSNNLLLPLNNGVPQTVNTATGAPIPTSLTGLNNDPYRGLEYSILKNKSSKLFPNANNITGAIGATTPGLDKITGFYSDFLEAAAYRKANNGLGLPYLSPGDMAVATQWNLNGASVTTLPNVAGTVTAAQLPGFILANSIVNNTVISNATLANGALDGNGTFTGITTINAGTAAAPITIGTPNTGFILQLGNDNGKTVTLSGANTYTGGTTIIAGSLIVANDAALGAAAPVNATIDPNNIKASVQANNGIIFNSLSEGMGMLTIGTTAGGGTSTFTTNRPIAVDGEVATINLNGYLTTLTGPIASLGALNTGLGNATGESDLTIDDTSTGSKGVLTLSGSNPLFYGNIVIGNVGTPTVRVTSDAALGNTTGSAASIGQIDLNSGTFQAGASFAAPERNVFLASGSNFDVAGFTTSFGTLTNVQRTLEILNSNTTTPGAVTFSNLTISATPTLQLAGGAAGETITLTNGIVRTGNDTLIIQPTSATSLGTTTEKLLSGTGAASLVNGIAPAYIVTNNGVAKSAGPYDFVTYGPNGYVKANYSQTTLANTPTSTVALAANATPAGNVSAFALNTEGKTITLGANTLTLGDGTNPGGLILATGSAVSGGTLAFAGSEGVVWLSGTNPTISSKITGTNGLTFAGSGAVAISTAAAVSGPITIDSGTVTLAGTNIFSTNTSGILLDNVKSKPAPSTLAITANNTLTALNSVGNNSAVSLGSGAALTVGDTTNNLSSTLSSTITETGAATVGALTFAGSGLFDLSGGKTTLASGSTVVVNNSAQLRFAVGAIGSSFGITLNGASELQLAQNGGGLLANTITGTGDLRLIGGTLQITGTGNTYSGGTFVETGSILDVTTANLPATNPNITNAGGLVVFDQATNGTYLGVISDGKQLGTGPILSGAFDKDDSTGGNTGNVTLAKTQTYTGATTVEAGTLTLGAVDTLATSSGVDLGRVGGGATATLALSANNTIQALTSEASNATAVTLGANVLTITTAAATTATFGGVISGAGSLVKSGAGMQTFTAANTYGGGTTVQAGELAVTGAGTLGATTGPLAVSGGILDLGTTAQTTGALTLTGGTIQNGTLTASSFGIQAGTISASLAGPAALTKTTGGTVVLSSANTYTGATTLSAGILSLTGSLGATTTTVANGATLAGTGTSAGSVMIANGGILSPGLPGIGNIGTLTVAGLTLQAGANLNLDLGQSNAVGPTSDRVQDNGQLTLGGTANIAPGQTFGPGAYRLVDYIGALTNNGLAVAGLPTGDTAQVQTAIAGQVNLVVVGPNGLVQYWDGAGPANDGTIQGGSGTWNATNGNWTSPDGAFDTQWASSFGVFAATAGTVTLADTEAFSGLEFSTTGYVVTAAAGVTLTPTGAAVLRADPGVTATVAAALTGSGSITKTDAGTIVLTGMNTYTGGTTIAAGTLQLGNGGTTGSIAGNVSDAGTLAFAHSDTETFGGTISGTGAVTQIGSGTTILTAANTVSGGTTIQAGTLQLGAGGATGSIIGNVLDNATLAFDHSDAETFAGRISGTGTTAQIGTGNTTLSGANTYTGGTTLTSGAITVANNAALGSGTLAMAPGTTLDFAPGANYTIANNVTVSGDPFFMTPGGQTDTMNGVIADGAMPGVVEKTGAGTLALTGTNTYTGGTTIQGGTLQIGNGGTTGSIVGNVADSGTLAFNRSNTLAFAGVISGPGTVAQIGTGTTTLTAINTYTGATTVNAGTLLVNGSIAASSGVTVAAGATIGGAGTLPALAVGAGTLAPGVTPGAIGTLAIGGNVTFSNASTYAVTVSPVAASLATATGGATLAGTVAATFQSGGYLTRRYTILTAAGGITGSFGALAGTDVPAGFKATLEYDANDAILDLTTTMATNGLSRNQTHVADALNGDFNRGGALPSGFVTVFGLTGPALAGSLSQLSGEGLTAAQNVAHRSGDLFTSTITDQTTFYGDAGGPANNITLGEPVSGLRELADAPAYIPVRPALQTRTWRAWATGFGGTEAIQGDVASGSNRQASTIYGGSLGVDDQLTPNDLLGVAVGGSDGQFRVPTLATSGSTTGGHVAIYDLATMGALYGASSTSFSYYTNKTYRTALADSERGNFDSHEIRSRVEFGRHFATGGATITPFVALEIADFRSNGFTETTPNGPSTFALNVSGQSTPSVPSFVGARLQQTMLLGNGMVFSPTLQLAYVHEFAPQRTLDAAFAALPGSTFLVDGARPDANAAQVKIGGELAIGASTALFANFDSEVSGRSQFYAGKGGLKVAW